MLNCPCTMSLAEKRVLVTRAKEQASDFVDALRAARAQPVAIPTLRLAAPADPEKLKAAVASADRYDWIVFTSVNGVDVFFEQLRAVNTASPHPVAIRAQIAAIGPATAEAARARGFTAAIVPPEYRGEAVAEAMQAFIPGGVKNLSILLPRAAGARSVLPDRLRQAGATVDVVEAYRMLGPDPASANQLRGLLQRRAIDVVTFTSSSTVSNTVQILGADAPALLAPFTIASIGPITTETAQKHGLRVDLTASEYTIEGLVAALRAYFNNH
jgi:uroporphyrinogen III methyltransferase / synthase